MNDFYTFKYDADNCKTYELLISYYFKEGEAQTRDEPKFSPYCEINSIDHEEGAWLTNEINDYYEYHED